MGDGADYILKFIYSTVHSLVYSSMSVYKCIRVMLLLPQSRQKTHLSPTPPFHNSLVLLLSVALFFKKNLFIYLFIFGCIGSSLLCTGFLQLRRAGATLCCSAWDSHCGGFSCHGAKALGAWAQQLWLAGSVVVEHRLSCSTTCGIFSDQGLNPCPLHWQADS